MRNNETWLFCFLDVLALLTSIWRDRKYCVQVLMRYGNGCLHFHATGLF